MDVLVLQHIACEPPGVYEDVLNERGATIQRVELDEGEPLPDWRAFDAIIAMGGPMGALDEVDHPWLADEKRLIGDAVRSGLPFWGVCLGVQLLAASLGARVYPGSAPEVGLLPVTLTDEALADPVFAGMPRELLSLQWHGDTFDLPDGAALLAGSPAYPNQAFRFGSCSLRRPVPPRGLARARTRMGRCARVRRVARARPRSGSARPPARGARGAFGRGPLRRAASVRALARRRVRA